MKLFTNVLKCIFITQPNQAEDICQRWKLNKGYNTYTMWPLHYFQSNGEKKH